MPEPQRKIKLSWYDLRKLLLGRLISPEEEIREITLVKPREILIHLERR